jgi:hypothetical protein
MLRAAAFIEPCLPSPADKPPSGSKWIHEIKHDGYWLMARRDPVGIRLITRRGNDWTERYPLVVEAVNHLKVRSCLIDGEVVCCDDRGLAVFRALRRRQNAGSAAASMIPAIDRCAQAVCRYSGRSPRRERGTYAAVRGQLRSFLEDLEAAYGRLWKARRRTSSPREGTASLRG